MEATPTGPPRAAAGPGRAPAFIDLDRVEADLAGVEHALTRLDDGTYGACQRCGAVLGGEVLRARPTASRCDVCA